MRSLKMYAAVAAALALGPTAPRYDMTVGNRTHRERSRPNSVDSAERMCAAQAKRERKNAARLACAADAQMLLLKLVP